MNNIKKYIPQLVIIGISCLIILAALSVIDGFVKLNSSKLDEQNENLKKHNQVLLNEIQSFKDSLYSTNMQIQRIYYLDKELANNYLQIKKSINNLKPKYEKAANYPINFNADSIKWYFSNLK